MVKTYSSCWHGRRKKQIFLLTVSGGFIFITFQLFSHIVLNRPSGLLSDEDVDMRFVRGNRHIQKPLVVEEDFIKYDVGKNVGKVSQHLLNNTNAQQI